MKGNVNALRLLHIVHDQKFIDSAHEQFETIVPGCNEYMILSKRRPRGFIKRFKPERRSVFSHYQSDFLESLKDYDAVIFHCLTLRSLEVIARADESVNFVWIGYGADYYDLIYPDPQDLLNRETRELANRYSVRFGMAWSVRRKRYMQAMQDRVLYPNRKKKASLVQRIAIFCPVLPREYELLRKGLGTLSPKYVQWNYGGNAALYSAGATEAGLSGSNILVGNSSDPTNNHIEVFRALKKIGLHTQTKVVVPLSYGDPGYREALLKIGKEILGENFYPITDFMPLAEYTELMRSCSVVILNHRRQQAIGNIVAGLFLGARVFLNPESCALDHFLEQQAVIHGFDEAISTPELLTQPLSDEQVAFNRRLASENWGWPSCLRKTQNLAEAIRAL